MESFAPLLGLILIFMVLGLQVLNLVHDKFKQPKFLLMIAVLGVSTATVMLLDGIMQIWIPIVWYGISSVYAIFYLFIKIKEQKRKSLIQLRRLSND